MARSAITFNNQSRIIHALASLAPHLDICADADKHCIYIEKQKSEEFAFLLQFIGNTPDKPLLGNVESNEISLNAIDLKWLEDEAKRLDPDFKPLSVLKNAISAEYDVKKYH